MKRESELARNMYGNTTVRLTEAVVEVQEYVDLVTAKMDYINAACAQAPATIEKWSGMDDAVAHAWAADRFAFLASLEDLRNKIDKLTIVIGDSVDLLGNVVESQ